MMLKATLALTFLVKVILKTRTVTQKFETQTRDSVSETNVRNANGDMMWRENDRTHLPKANFSGPQPGPTVELDPDAKEFDFLGLFFPVFLIEMLVDQTNLYARQKQETKPDPNWRPVVFEELKAWLGIRIFMSILYLPATALYWSTDALFGNLSLRRIMKRDRFDKICQYFHANDRTRNPPRGQSGHDKLFHVRHILDEVHNNCLSNYNPHKNVSVDEGIVKFRGRLAFKQYLPAKPTKYGIKVWMRADPVNGYVNEFQIYTGRENGNVEKGLASCVVQDLTRKIWGKHHVVNMDNYFTSPTLFETLLNNDTYARGTVQSNRKDFPVKHLHLRDAKEQGQYKTSQKGEMTACIWKDKRHIYMLSTADNPSQMDSEVSRRTRNGELKQVRAPSIVPEYNTNMNGVVHADQIRTEYSTFRMSKRWWLYLFWFLLDLAVANAFIVMKESVNH